MSHISPVRARVLAEEHTGPTKAAILSLANDVENLRSQLAQTKRELRRAKDELQDSRIGQVEALLTLRKAKK